MARAVWLVVGCAVGAMVAAMSVAGGARGQQAATPSSQAPAAAGAGQPEHLKSEEEHQREMDALHVTAVGPGADGNPDSPRAANFDEAKGPAFRPPPDPLVMNDGKKVTSAA